jgi:hypothetical protein
LQLRLAFNNVSEECTGVAFKFNTFVTSTIDVNSRVLVGETFLVEEVPVLVSGSGGNSDVVKPQWQAEEEPHEISSYVDGCTYVYDVLEGNGKSVSGTRFVKVTPL